ncbi:disulfide bond formation protein DsbB [Burkholderiales bacterium JOSHI_001]|nr:disulfide bond formation protein DsbB [Burkholderiales bacterium JOSHI_001]
MSLPTRNPDLLLGGVAAAAAAAVGMALFSQYRWDMQPCPWCVLQRAITVAIALAALLGLLWRAPLGRRLGAGLVLVLGACGVAAALWQHFVAAASASCAMTLADRIMGALALDSTWPDIFAARASCADAKVNLAGIPYEFWSLALFLLLMLAALQVFRRPAPGP